MHLDLQPAQHLEIRMALQVSDGMTLTVFPRAERWLHFASDHQWAARHVRSKCKETSFRSLVDYLFVAVFPDCYFVVMAYYADEGPLSERS